MKLQESGEMYLETILVLSKKQEVVRAIDISKYRNYSKPSVSRAMGILKKNGYINVAENDAITLTDQGLEVAKKIYERHTVLTNILTSLGVSKETAEEDACRMEHVISDETFEVLRKQLKK